MPSPPHQSSLRILLMSWWIACVVLYAAYMANNIAYLSVDTNTMPFQTLAEMAQQTEYNYGTEDGAIAMLVFEVF